jgi:hypothetical protein
LASFGGGERVMKRSVFYMVTITMLLLLIGSQRTLAQSDASLEETQKWIKSKLEDYSHFTQSWSAGGQGCTRTERVTNVQFESGKMSLDMIVSEECKDRYFNFTRRDNYRWILRDLDPNRIAVNEFPRTVQDGEATRTTNKQYYRVVCKYQKGEYRAEFYFDDVDLANRFARAFKHLLNLVQSEREPF